MSVAYHLGDIVLGDGLLQLHIRNTDSKFSHLTRIVDAKAFNVSDSN